MFLTDWLMMKGFFAPEEVDQINLRNVSWAFGHISRGMYTAERTPRTYSQLAAIQVGSFMKSAAIVWKSNEVAANGKDSGCLEISFENLPPAIRTLETTVLRIKATGDRAGAENLKAEFVDASNDFAKIKGVIAERWLRAPKATFVYSLKL